MRAISKRIVDMGWEDLSKEMEAITRESGKMNRLMVRASNSI